MKARVVRLELESCCLVLILAVLLIAYMEDSAPIINQEDVENINKPCDHEFYVVEEHETLYSIAERCSDRFILSLNPHIQNSDDIFPGVVLRLEPF